MKKIFYSLLATAFIAGLVSCNNGDYVADPQSNGNGAVNPITPLTDKEFNWSNTTDILSAEINGSKWTADHVSFALDSSGSNVIIGTKDQSPVVLQLYMRDVWTGNLYSMEWQNYSRYASYRDASSMTEGAYLSYLSNSGGLKITHNDTDAINGMFYFKAVSATGKVMNISKGVLNFRKM